MVYSTEALSNLIAQFQQGLYYPHHTWLDPIREICIKCWKLARGNNEQIAMVNYAGFLILPGLISVMKKIKGGQRPIDFLLDKEKEEFPGKEIVRKDRIFIAVGIFEIGGKLVKLRSFLSADGSKGAVPFLSSDNIH
jgi:hypothetical protein